MSPPLVAAILPPHEGFGPGQAGAIGMVARAQAQTPGFRAVVFGGPQSRVFGDVAFRAVRPAWWFPGNVNLRFGAALLRPLRRLRPALVEVHNRPELALFLARWLPRTRVALFLHNDPQSMRRARTPAERTVLLRRLAGVVTVSEYL
ncbi:MAG TPA: glycosyltransferase, partial [Acetobacteraceae bacterium]|nr:glycosyltransferase [Acetobacteraceae bacterium]